MSHFTLTASVNIHIIISLFWREDQIFCVTLTLEVVSWWRCSVGRASGTQVYVNAIKLVVSF